MFFDTSKVIRFFAGLVILSSLLTVYFTGERTALIVMLLGILFLPLLAFVTQCSKKVKIASSIFYVLCFFSFIGMIWLITPQGRVVGEKALPYIAQKTLYRFSDGFKDRIAIWSIGLQGFNERPLTGWGWENFNVVFNKFVDPTASKVFFTEPWFDRSHNQIIDIMTLSGVIGSAAYILMWCIIFFLYTKSTGER